MRLSLDSLLSRVGTEGLGVLDAQGCLHAANPALQRLLASDERALAELPIDDEARARLRQFLVADLPRVEMSTTWRTASGPRRMRLTLLRGDDGACAVAVRDETELHAARRELEQCARLRSLGRIGRHLVHDMNNHMSAVVGLGDALQARDADEQRLLDALRSSARRAGRMLESVAMLVRRAGMRVPASDLPALVADAERLVHKPMLVARRSLHVQVAEAVPRVRCVPQEVTHALVSLLLFANATAATPDVHLRVLGERRRQAAGLPERPCGVVRIEDGGDAERSPLQSADVLQAIGVVQARGGWLACGRGEGGGRWLELALPAVVGRPA